MEANTHVTAHNQTSPYQQNTNQEILRKSLEKSTEIKQQQQAGEPRVIDKTRGEKQGTIDLYA